MKNVNLGQYDLKQLLRDPSLIHRIEDKIADLKGDSLFVMSIRASGSYKNTRQAMNEIIDQYRDNPKLTTQLIGRDLLDMIEEFDGITLADDIGNVL